MITDHMLKRAAQVFRDAGLEISLPSEGTLDDVERERYETLKAALTAALSDQPNEPTGTICKMGWMPDDTGRVFFGAIVEYKNGPPDLPIKIAWDKTPVRIIAAAPPPSSTAGGGK